MKKGLFIFLFLIFNFCAFSQTYIKGKVTTNTNETLEGASVYLNNTTVGTTTNSKGEFSLKANKGNYDLVVSFIGHTTYKININTNLKVKFLEIKLIPKVNVLDEVVIKKTKYDDDWKYNLHRFKLNFLGRTKLAKDVTILNPKVLHFEFNNKTGELTADAREPLKIKHKSLGYLITYDLVSFSIKNNRLFFSGYARYSNLKKKIKKKWKRNRLEAYNGSQMHFLRSLLENNLAKAGFVINQFRRELNPDRPTEEEIKAARKLISLHGKTFTINLNSSTPLTKIDSARITLKNSSKPKYQDFLYKRNIPYKEMISFKNTIPFLDFENYLSIIYKNEKEEENYLNGMFGRKKLATGMQTSNIVLLYGKSPIDKTGILASPDAAFVEGYWAFESFANMLPLDYLPSNSAKN